MALLITGLIVAGYAIVITVFHMKQQEELEILKQANVSQTCKIANLKFQIRHLEWKLQRAEENAREDFDYAQKRIDELKAGTHDAVREKNRLLEINNRLMERLKRKT